MPAKKPAHERRHHKLPHAIPANVPAGTLTVSSTNDNVYSLSTGQVSSVIHVADENVVIVQFGSGSFLVYKGLATASVKKGDFIKKARPLGNAIKNDKTGKYEVGLQLWKADAETLDKRYTPKQMMDIHVNDFISGNDLN